MTFDEVVLMLSEHTDWNPDALREHEAFDDFARAMRDRQYGPGPLASAWSWFQAGWYVDKNEDRPSFTCAEWCPGCDCGAYHPDPTKRGRVTYDK